MAHDDGLLALVLDERTRALLAEYGCTARLELDESSAAALTEALRGDRARACEREADTQKLIALGELVAGIVHEVRNIATSIRGFAQIARRKRDSADELPQLIATIEREAARCADVTDAFLRFARREPSHKQHVALADAVEQAAALVTQQLRIRGIALAMSLSDDVPPIFVDQGELVQVIVNLVLNAQHAIGTGGEIAIATGRSGDRARLEIADTGPGVPDELRQRIFEPFFTTKPPGEGTGLGLAVSARLVEANGGTLALAQPGADELPRARDSSPRFGARFVVELPGYEGH